MANTSASRATVCSKPRSASFCGATAQKNISRGHGAPRKKLFICAEDRSRASATSISVRVTSTASVSSGPSPSKKRRRCDALSEVIVEGRATTKKPDDDGTNRRTRSSATAAGAAFAVFAGVTNATAARARRATAQSSTKKRCSSMVSRHRCAPLERSSNQSAIGLTLVQFFTTVDTLELRRQWVTGAQELAYGTMVCIQHTATLRALESGGSAPDPATSHSAPPVTYVLTTRRSVGAFFLRRWVHLWPEGIKLTVNANQGTPDQETKSSLGLLHRKTPLAEPLVSV